MALKIATDVLKMGFTVAAVPGNTIEVSDEDIEKYGWADKVKDAPDADAPAKSRRKPAAEA